MTKFLYPLLAIVAVFSLSMPYASEPSYPYDDKRIPPTCEPSGSGHVAAEIRDLVDDPEAWEGKRVSVKGEWSYLEKKTLYTLRDGIHVIPLKHWRCYGEGDFGGTPTYAEIIGVVVLTDGQPFIVIDEILLPKPQWVETATTVGGISAAILILVPVIRVSARRLSRSHLRRFANPS